MHPLSLPPRLAFAADALAVIVFATVGLISHDHSFTALHYARDILPVLGGFVAVGVATGLYTRPTWRSYAVTWLVGVTAGIVVRALILRHSDLGKEATFLVVALISVLVFDLAIRTVFAAVRR